MSIAAVAPAAVYEVEAYNTSKQSDNKIHDDAVARKFGFAGGLVPGVDVYAYLTHPAVERWGRDWLERGAADCRLLKPVYDGALATITTEAVPGEDNAMTIKVESAGQLCAQGTARLPDAAPVAADLADFPSAPCPPNGPRPRPKRCRKARSWALTRWRSRPNSPTAICSMCVRRCRFMAPRA